MRPGIKLAPIEDKQFYKWCLHVFLLFCQKTSHFNFFFCWNQLKINYIVQKNTKKYFTVLWRNGMMVVRRASSFAFEQSLFCKKKVTNAEYKLPQKWRHYHKGSRQRKEGWCIFPRILAIYQKSETNFPYQIKQLFWKK